MCSLRSLRSLRFLPPREAVVVLVAMEIRSEGECGVRAHALVALATWFALALAPTSASRNSGYVGDICANGTGVCREMSKCPAAIAALRRTERPAVCGHDGPSPIVCCPYDGKATRRCSKYGEAVWKSEKTFSLLPQFVQRSQCEGTGIPFIVGGEKAISNEFPHMALLGYGSDGSAPRWQCGGSLISERFVMTAAHCLHSPLGQPRWVRLGELNLANDREKNRHEDYEVQSTTAHPQYRDGIFYHDVALLRLSKDVTFTASIRPACVHAIPEVPHKQLIASGWGYTEWDIPEVSEHLMKVKLPVQEAEVCQTAFRTLATTRQLRSGINASTMVCAGALEGGKDTCRGDSGGPLQFRLHAPFCMYAIAGVTSFGKMKCGASSSPAVYTRVSYYVPWIEMVVWKDHDA